MSDTRILLTVHESLIEMISVVTKLSKPQVWFRLNDEAMKTSSRLINKNKSNWSTNKFSINNMPLRLTIKAKFTGYGGRRAGDIVCTFGLQKGKSHTLDSQDILNEMFESTLLKDKI